MNCLGNHFVLAVSARRYASCKVNSSPYTNTFFLILEKAKVMGWERLLIQAVRVNNVAKVKKLINNIHLDDINLDMVNSTLQEQVLRPAKFEVATLLLSVPMIREHAIKHVKFLQHNQIEKLVQAFNPKIEDGGVCSGFTDLWI